jgi:hypothetical protein
VPDPVTALPEEERWTPIEPHGRALRLLRRPDFRSLFLAVSASQLGDSLHYIALMWVALQTGGPLGVVAVRLADSIPALLFGLHGGLAADRWNRRSLMLSADLVLRSRARADRGRRSLRPPLPLGARRRLVRARGGDELLRAGVRRARPALVDRATSSRRTRASRPPRRRSPPAAGRSRRPSWPFSRSRPSSR